MATTDNLHLYIFDVDDYADVEVINENMQLIDEGWQSLNNRGSSNSGKFLRVGSDGVVSPYAILNATQGAAGFMSAADKLKLDGIAANANNYSLPTAASGTKGGIKTGYTQSGKNYPVQMSGENAFVSVPWTDTTYSPATTSANGLMSSADKTKLNGIQAGAQVNPGLATGGANGLMSASDKTKLNGIQAGAQVNPDNATQSASGLMSFVDKQKLDGIAYNANNYSLPLAGSSQRGGVKVGGSHGGNSFDSHIDGNEFLYVTVPDATTSAPGTMSAADKTKLNGIATGATRTIFTTYTVEGNAIEAAANGESIFSKYADPPSGYTPLAIRSISHNKNKIVLESVNLFYGSSHWQVSSSFVNLNNTAQTPKFTVVIIAYANT